MSVGDTYFPTVRREPFIVAYWRLNDAAGVTEYLDSGARYDFVGTPQTSNSAGPALIQVDSVAGSSLFGSGNASFFVTDTAPLRVTGDVSIEMWLAPYTQTQSCILVGKQNSGGSIASPYALRMTNGRLQFARGNGTTEASITGGVPPVSLPSYVVATCFRGEMTIYINGDVVANGSIGSQSVTDGGESFYVGAVGTAQPYNGLVGELALHAGALSQRRVTRHFTIGQQILTDQAHNLNIDYPVLMS